MKQELPLAVCHFLEDGSIFPVCHLIWSKDDAETCLSWMKRSGGDDWRIVPMKDVDVSKLFLQPYIDEAKEKIRNDFLATQRKQND